MAVQELYISYLGRPADPTGLVNFEAALLAANAPTDIQSLNTAYNTNPAIQTLVNSFQTSAEAGALYGNGSTTAFIAAIYQNVLGRTPVPGDPGLAFWVNAIASGQLSQGDAALSIMAGALANTTAQGLLDGQLVTNRLAMASYFTTRVSSQNAVSAYSGNAAAAGARTMLNGVTAATDTAAFDATVNAAVAALFGADVSTLEVLAGNMGGAGYVNGAGAAARFNYPTGIAADSAGNVYVADYGDDTIRKITPAGAVSTLAGTSGARGSVDGIGEAARFNFPSIVIRNSWGDVSGVAADSAGNVYVADTGNRAIRKITPAGAVSTLAGTAAGFSDPSGVATDSAGNVYVVDEFASVISKITPAGVVSTLAGTASATGSADGIGSAARFYQPESIATDSAGNVYVADTRNNTIRKITPAGLVSTLAGTASSLGGSADGAGATASFQHPTGVATDSAGNVYVADNGNNTIRKITPAGMVTTVIGVPGQAGFAAGALPGGLSTPVGVAISGTSLYITTANGVAVVNNLP